MTGADLKLPPAADDADADAELALLVGGQPQLRRGGEMLRTGTRKALALAVMLVLEPSLRRGRVADLLWPEADPAAARRNVRRDLYRLRQAGLPVADDSGDALRIGATTVEWPAPAPLPPRWLDGLDEVAGAEFSHWVDATRERLQRQWLEHLAGAARGLESHDPAAAAHAWRALLADGAAGPDHPEARASLQRLEPEPPAFAEALAAQAARPAGVQRLPFHGRDAELAALRAALARGLTVLLDGGPGAGKSRLALESLAPRGAALVVRCRPEDSAVPYASALRGLQAAREAAPQAPVPAWARRDLAGLVAEWGRGSAAAELPEPARLLRAYRAALQALTAETFDALLIDDWQWADEPSRGLWDLEALRDIGGPALPCVIAHRSGELPPAALQRRRRWVDAGLAAALTLRPLSDGQSRALVAALAPALQPVVVSGAWLDEIVARCAGNPLFLIETLRHGAANEADAAPGVRDIIVTRARALGPAVRRVLEAASLSGDDLAPPLLAAALGSDELVVAQSLEHAAAAELLHTDTLGRQRFAHDLFAQVIGDSLSQVRRAALHGQLATALERVGAEPGRVARHYDLAGRAADAAPWHLQAARVALQRQAWAEAVAAANAVIEAATSPPLRVDARLLLARARMRQSDAASSEAALEAAWADAARAGPACVAEVCLARAELFASTGRATRAMDELSQLEADPALTAELKRRLLQQRATALSCLGRHDESLPQLQRLLDELPPSALVERLQVRNVLARNAYWAGQLEASRAHVEQGLALARTLDDEVDVARGLHRLGALDRERGLVERSNEWLAEAAEVARRVGHVEILRSVLATQITTCLDRLQLVEAEALIAEGESASPFWETPDLEDVFDERRYRLHWLRGDIDGAWQITSRSFARHRGGGHLHSHLGTLLQAVRLALGSGDVARAREFLDQAQALHGQVGADSLHGQELDATRVLVLQAEGRAAEACTHAQAWLAVQQPRRVEEHVRLLVAAAQAALDLGRTAPASEWLAQAAALPVAAYELEALVLLARLRLARAGGAPLAKAQAALLGWLGRDVLPELERRLVVQALADAAPAAGRGPAAPRLNRPSRPSSSPPPPTSSSRRR